MNDSRPAIREAKPLVETTPQPQPMFRRHQIKVKAGIRLGALPTGHPPIGF